MSPSYLYHAQPSSGFISRAPRPPAVQVFCRSIRRFVSEKAFLIFGSIAASHNED
jgi:hypothetical protein